MKERRTYTMRARAGTTASTRQRILGATVGLAGEKLLATIVLADVAERAGVSVQTVLRHFGSREGLFEAARASLTTEVTAERAAPPGDVEAAMAAIAAHYELRGGLVLRLLAQAQFDPEAAALVEPGRVLHAEWVATTFAPQLEARPGLADLLAVATDVQTWALLRRDHDAATTGRRLLRLVRALLDSEGDA